MGWEIPVLAGVTEAPAGDIETPNFCRDGGDDEDRDKRSQDRQSPEIKTPHDQGKTAEDFQPRQIKSEADTDRPRKDFVIVDVISETHRASELQIL